MAKVTKARSDESVDTAPYVPNGLVTAGAWSWRILAILAVLAVVIFLTIQLKVIVIPFLIAILVTALLMPLSIWLQKHGWPKWLAVITTLVGIFSLIGALLFVVARQLVSIFPELRTRSIESYESFKLILSGEPFNISATDISNFGKDIVSLVQENSQFLATGLGTVGSTTGNVLIGLFLALFATIFILIDGKIIWEWFVGLFPEKSRQTVDGAGRSSWKTLIGFVQTRIVIAAADAIGIGLGALLLQVPLALPIAVMVFLGSFIPVIGAVATGFIAVFIALVFNGWLPALIMLGIVLVVQQIEGNILEPFVTGKAVKIHPLAIVFGVAIGSLLAGIPGALFAVPIIAVANTTFAYIAKKQKTSNRPVT